MAYVATNYSRSLGERIRDARLSKERGLRDLARQLEITPSYLSDIEADRRAPAEPLLREVALLLDLNIDELVDLAGRLDTTTERYLKRTPGATMLFRRISEKDLPPEKLAKIREMVEQF
jgi:transcriptional regulator with XRE-family HTH domain